MMTPPEMSLYYLRVRDKIFDTREADYKVDSQELFSSSNSAV